MASKRRRTRRLGISRTLDEGAASFYPSNIQLSPRLVHAHDPRTDQRRQAIRSEVPHRYTPIRIPTTPVQTPSTTQQTH